MTLGYHRQPPSGATADEDAAANKPALFWFAYMLDRGLALRLGRASAIQDYDITRPRTMGRRTGMPDQWREAMDLWIAHAEVQGLAYEQLYSPAALAGPPARRAECARLLARRLEDIADRGAALRGGVAGTSGSGVGMGGPEQLGVIGAMTIAVLLKSDEVLVRSSMALVYRAVPAAPGLPSSLSAECVEEAREAFRSHQEVMELTASSTVMKNTYLHW